MAEWFDGIREAVTSEPRRGDSIEKLASFMVAHRFEHRLKEVEFMLMREQHACKDLLERADLFHAEALDLKASELLQLLGADFYRDDALSTVKGLKNLEEVYNKVDKEIDRVKTFLETKKDRFIPWLGSRQPRPATV